MAAIYTFRFNAVVLRCPGHAPWHAGPGNTTTQRRQALQPGRPGAAGPTRWRQRPTASEACGSLAAPSLAVSHESLSKFKLKARGRAAAGSGSRPWAGMSMDIPIECSADHHDARACLCGLFRVRRA